MNLTIKTAGCGYDEIAVALMETARQLDLNDLDKVRSGHTLQKQIVSKLGVHTVIMKLE